MHKVLIAFLLLAVSFPTASAATGRPDAERNPPGGRTVYVFPLHGDIMPAQARLVSKCLREAADMNAACVVVDLNTYGGLLDAADSIRTMLLNFPGPTITFVNNQAASAGALIALATDSIYMRPGASIGAATVVDRSGSEMPDKYQSFMRAMMRATAEAHGREPSDRTDGAPQRWRRDPRIAEAMVDSSVTIPGLTDSTEVVTLTADEAVAWGFCEGKAASVEEVLALAGMDDCEIYEYRLTRLDRLTGFLSSPVIQALCIMLIIGGIWFELQSPGIGFPLAAAVLGAVLYFAPLYMEGLVAYWEPILFLAGVVLLVLELFVTPGFGVLGVLGIVAMVTGLAFALIDADLLHYIPTGELPVSVVLGPFLIVVISAGTGLLLSVWLGNRFLGGKSRLRRRIVLASDLRPDEGYVSVATGRELTGRDGVAATPLHPSGKVVIEGRHYEAAGENAAFIRKGAAVTVVRDENGVLYCREKEA